jgi:hypothetical protein
MCSRSNLSSVPPTVARVRAEQTGDLLMRRESEKVLADPDQRAVLAGLLQSLSSSLQKDEVNDR